jgi:hypothetical protein
MVGGWVLAVAGATTVGWAGVGLVGDEVSPSAPTILSQAEVQRRIHSSASAPLVTQAPVTGTTASPALPGSTTCGGTVGSAGTGPGPAADGASPTAARTTGGAVGGSATATPPVGPSAQRRSYTTHGGRVVLSCLGTQITAVTSPLDGFTAAREPLDQGAGVKVEFQSATSESKLVGRCTGGTPSATVDELGSSAD